MFNFNKLYKQINADIQILAHNNTNMDKVSRDVDNMIADIIEDYLLKLHTGKLTMSECIQLDRLHGKLFTILTHNKIVSSRYSEIEESIKIMSILNTINHKVRIKMLKIFLNHISKCNEDIIIDHIRDIDTDIISIYNDKDQSYRSSGLMKSYIYVNILLNCIKYNKPAHEYTYYKKVINDTFDSYFKEYNFTQLDKYII
ncbi:MAG: hypothetical protein ACRCXT_18635 [Paraclostridium sp.]